MANRIIGQKTWDLTRTRQGHRIYTIVHHVRAENNLTGPDRILLTPGLPVPGATWTQFHASTGKGNNCLDDWAWCRLDGEVRPHFRDDKCLDYDVKHTFSTEPLDFYYDAQPFDNPLLQPNRISNGDGGSQGDAGLSGGFIKKQIEAKFDLLGLIQNSSHEQITGTQVEFDFSHPTIKVEQNVLNLEWAKMCRLIDHVNDNFLWGLEPRTIKFTNASWQKKFYNNLFPYYTRILEFEVCTLEQPDSDGVMTLVGWDRIIPDRGTKVLRGEWNAHGTLWILDPVNPPDQNNPKDFIKFYDSRGNPTDTLLVGGRPYDPDTDGPHPDRLLIGYYPETNLLSQFGLPASF